LRFIVTGSCNSSRHQRLMREKFFKNEIREKISQRFHDQWKIGQHWSTFSWKVWAEK